MPEKPERRPADGFDSTDYMDATDVVRFFGGKVRRTAAYSLMRRLGAKKVGGRVLLPREALDRYLAAQSPQPALPPKSSRHKPLASRPPASGFIFLPPE